MAFGALFALVPARRTGHALVVDDELDLAGAEGDAGGDGDAPARGGDDDLGEREPVGAR
jgi:hypothetical protein